MTHVPRLTLASVLASVTPKALGVAWKHLEQRSWSWKRGGLLLGGQRCQAIVSDELWICKKLG